MSTPLIIHTEKNGELPATGQQDVDAIFAGLRGEKKIVFHFHGGLVKEEAGRQTAVTLDPEYRRAGAVPVFFVWESGLLEVVTGNVQEIAGEDFFKVVLKWVAKFVLAKVAETVGGGRSLDGQLALPPDIVVYQELAVRDAGAEPFARVNVPETIPEVTDADEAQLAAALEADLDFQETVQAIVDASIPQTEATGARGLVVRTRGSARTLMSPEVLDEVKADVQAANAAGGRGLLSTAALLNRARKVLTRVISRFRRGHDHGVYPTIMEEILREFYLANVGAAVWTAMKNETRDTFGQGTRPRGGRYAIAKLKELIVQQPDTEITLVGHSTGAVFINNLLAHLEERRADPADPFPSGFQFQNVVFLAPACTFRDFHAVVQGPRADMFRNFRMFTMTDDAESKDQLVKYVYTRSLLYFISGVLEYDDGGRSTPDIPVVGMARYYERENTYGIPEVSSVRKYVRANQKHAVWSPVVGAGSDGFRCRAESHGAFDTDPPTLESIRAMIHG